MLDRQQLPGLDSVDLRSGNAYMCRMRPELRVQLLHSSADSLLRRGRLHLPSFCVQLRDMSARRAQQRAGAVALASLVLALASGCSSDDTGDREPATGGATAAGGMAGDAGGASGADAQVPAGGSGGTGNACLPPLARCDGSRGVCCDGSVCVEEEEGVSRCRKTCTERADCETYCCVEDAALGLKLCAAETLCPSVCFEQGDACSTTGPRCCDPLICVASTVSDYAGCRPTCTDDDDCSDGCCVPFADGSTGFCAGSGACGCGSEGQTCGGAVRCCGNLVCAGTSPTVFACYPRCSGPSDCDTGCCIPVTGTGDSACMPCGG